MVSSYDLALDRRVIIISILLPAIFPYDQYLSYFHTFPEILESVGTEGRLIIVHFLGIYIKIKVFAQCWFLLFKCLPKGHEVVFY